MKGPAVFGLLLFLTTAAYPQAVALSKLESGILAELGLQEVRGAPQLLDFTLDDLAGNKVKLSSFQGKVVLLNFWATWCPPCRAEMPSMEKLFQSLRDNPDFVFLAVDSQEDPKTVKTFIEKNKYHFPVLLDENGAVTAQYSVRAYPTTYVIDRQGRVVGGIIGAHEWGTPETLSSITKLIQLR